MKSTRANPALQAAVMATTCAAAAWPGGWLGGGRCAADITITTTAGPGLNLAIPDGGYDGSLASMAAVVLEVAAPAGAIITHVHVQVAMTHTWVGDLTVKLRAPGGPNVTLMSRPGMAELADDGGDESLSDSSDLLSAFPVEFWELPTLMSAELMGSEIPGYMAVCRDDFDCYYRNDHGAATPGNLDSFIGQNPTGTWRLRVGDSYPVDSGTIDRVTLTITASVPCVADVNSDAAVNVTDLLAVIGAWGSCSAPCPPRCGADVAPSRAGDCQVNVTDLLAVISAWGPCP